MSTSVVGTSFQLAEYEKTYEAVVETAVDSAIASQPLAQGKIFVGNTNGVAAAQTPGGIVAMSTAGSFSITCAQASLLVGNGSSNAAAVAMSGAVALTSAGVTTLPCDQAKILVGNGSSNAVHVAVSGAVALTSAGVTSLPCDQGKFLVGNSSSNAVHVAASGVVALASDGAFSFSTNYFKIASTDTNGEIAIANMTTNGGIIVLPREACDITHQAVAAGKVTLYIDGTTNVAASKSVAYVVVAL